MLLTSRRWRAARHRRRAKKASNQVFSWCSQSLERPYASQWWRFVCSSPSDGRYMVYNLIFMVLFFCLTSNFLWEIIKICSVLVIVSSHRYSTTQCKMNLTFQWIENIGYLFDWRTDAHWTLPYRYERLINLRRGHIWASRSILIRTFKQSIRTSLEVKEMQSWRPLAYIKEIYLFLLLCIGVIC